MESISLEDLDEVDLLLTELEISQGKRNLILCTVASPAYREKIIEVIKARLPCRVKTVENGDNLIFDLRNAQAQKEEILIWTLPETLSNDILDALNNFRELFYDVGVPSLVFMTPAGLDDVIWKAPDFWRYRGGYHILKGEDHGLAYQATEALSMPFSFRYQNKEELLRRKRINEYLLKKMSNQREQEKILNEMGLVYFVLGDAKKAFEYYEQALIIAREIGDRRNEGVWLGNLGTACAALGAARKAIEYYEQHLAIARGIGDRTGEGNALGNLGAAYAALGDAPKSVEYCEQALIISREIGDRRGEGADLGNLGAAYARMGETRKAIEYCEQAMAIAREIGDKRNEGTLLGNLGNVCYILRDARKAIDYYEQQLKITQEIGDRRSEGNALWNMSLALDKLGKIAKAIECAKSALKIHEEIEDPRADKIRRKLQEWESQQQKQ
ncbi:MAG: tetratricopeptide repeat protein [Methanothrix sp.]